LLLNNAGNYARFLYDLRRPDLISRRLSAASAMALNGRERVMLAA